MGSGEQPSLRVSTGKMKVDIKTLITIITLGVPLVGFYYTTNMRLDSLEASVTSVQKQIKQLKKNKGRKK